MISVRDESRDNFIIIEKSVTRATEQFILSQEYRQVCMRRGWLGRTTRAIVRDEAE